MSLNIPNLDRLISHLEGLPEEKFNMRYLWTLRNGEAGSRHDIHDCGTAACIAGWIIVIAGEIRGHDGCPAQHWLGINNRARNALFLPDENYRTELYPLSRAIRTLKHMRSEYLRTGQVVVDWDAPEPAERESWAAPVASERTLPVALTSLLGTPVYSEVL